MFSGKRYSISSVLEAAADQTNSNLRVTPNSELRASVDRVQFRQSSRNHNTYQKGSGNLEPQPLRWPHADMETICRVIPNSAGLVEST